MFQQQNALKNTIKSQPINFYNGEIRSVMKNSPPLSNRFKESQPSQNYNRNMDNKDKMEVVDSLKAHLRHKYPMYSELEIERLIYKFLNEYLMS